VKRLLETLARTLVDNPGEVHVEDWSEDGVLHLDLDVAASDRGHVIGRKGRTADALRTLIEAAAKRRGIPADMEILD
jgi:uncharacterized protein